MPAEQTAMYYYGMGLNIEMKQIGMGKPRTIKKGCWSLGEDEQNSPSTPARHPKWSGESGKNPLSNHDYNITHIFDSVNNYDV